MKPLVIDYETYFDSDVSLKKLPEPAYIHHPEFEVFGLSFYDMEDGSTGWIDESDVKAFHEDRKFSDRMVVAHNAQFDLSVSSYVYGVKPKLAACTMQMAYAVLGNRLASFSLDAVSDHLGLGGKEKKALVAVKGKHADEITPLMWQRLIDYAIKDAVLCGAVFKALCSRMNKNNFIDMDWHIRQSFDPVLVTDRDVLQQALDEEAKKRADGLAEFGLNPSQLRSAQKFAEVLRSYGVEPPKKISAATGKEAYDFSKQSPAFMSLVEKHPDDKVRRLCQLKLTVQSTAALGKLERYLQVHDALGGRKPILVNWCGAVQTKRPSGRSKLNDLNMPRKSLIRHSVRAPKGHLLVVADLSGAELRICRFGVRDHKAIEIIKKHGDLYVDFYADMAKIDTSQVTDDQRFVGKVCQLSLQYATGAEKLSHTVWSWGRVSMSGAESRRIVQHFRKVAHPALPKAWRWIERNVLPHLAEKRAERLDILGFPIYAQDGKVHLPSGLAIEYPHLRMNKQGEWVYKRGRMQGKVYGGSFIENISQALTTCVLSDKHRSLMRKGFRVAHSVYDELVLVARKEDAEQVAQTLEDELSKPVPWWPELLLEAEAGFDVSYRDAKP